MEIRRVRKHEIQQAINLADKTFRNEGHTSMGEAFPHIFTRELSFGAFDGDRLVSFMGLVPSKITLGEAVLQVFSIGAVCTDVDYRNQGLSSKILNEVYQYIDQAHASLLLISGDRGLYTRNHCSHFGNASKYLLDKDHIIKHTYDGEIRLANPTDIFQIDDIRQQGKVRYESNLWEWSMLIEAGGYTSIFKMKQSVFVAVKNNRIESYVVIGIPTEQSTKKQAIVTEWGGNSKAIHKILMDVLNQNLTSEMEITIPWQDELANELIDIPHEEKKNSGTVYVVNAGRLIEQLKPLIGKMGLNFSVSETENRGVILQYKDSKVIMSAGEFVNWVFDGDFKTGVSELDDVFPIPFPYTEGIHYV
ncbi:GNAT family N-acetyltransferase [Ferdinandcohnia quinoae]|uniref:GNAT family N-acetyltransferase n=1 Tax=Fredinandcohnia quinoae TaxID=2918902 RepID=A0AAW5E0N5_9BACI|nr:GNAT family N-acetyltransferase [Fredinandcohnia sp. SECRCQ15]MCH1626475.1 GNAT family N-acetyltransferase [Fredinandcohnia sp. SECRCQ15]